MIGNVVSEHDVFTNYLTVVSDDQNTTCSYSLFINEACTLTKFLPSLIRRITISR